MIYFLSEVEVESPDRARAGAFAQLEDRRQGLDWSGWDQRNVHISDPLNSLRFLQQHTYYPIPPLDFSPLRELTFPLRDHFSPYDLSRNR